MKRSRIQSGFTLAEVMITLVVIGLITAIVMPIMVNSAPKKKYMKFKKAHTTFGKVISELVNSDQYYKDGDLGIMPNGNLVNSPTYLCETMADVLTVKKVTCSDVLEIADEINGDQFHVHLGSTNGVDNTDFAKWALDIYCRDHQKEEIITTDNITYFQVAPTNHFGRTYIDTGKRLFGGGSKWGDEYTYDENGELINVTIEDFDLIYKILCIDIDGINKGEDPFGYGVRADGKILTSAKVDEWLEKDFNGNDPSEQEE